MPKRPGESRVKRFFTQFRSERLNRDEKNFSRTTQERFNLEIQKDEPTEHLTASWASTDESSRSAFVDMVRVPAECVAVIPHNPVMYELKKYDVGDKNGFNLLAISEQEFPTVQEVLEFAVTTSNKPVLYIHVDRTSRDVRSSCKAVFCDPLIVESIERFFVPVFVSITDNNIEPGEIGFVDQTGHHCIPPIPVFKLSKSIVVDSIIQVLHLSGLVVPQYIQLLREEVRTVHCRILLGVDKPSEAEIDVVRIAGILGTKAGLYCNKKALEVVYDPARVSFGMLSRYALTTMHDTLTLYYRSNDERIAAQIEVARLCSTTGNANLDVKVNIERYNDSTPLKSNYLLKPALRRTPMTFVPLTELQSSRSNRLISLGRFDEATHLLSPRQGKILMDAMRQGSKTFFDVVHVPISDGWMSVSYNKAPLSRIDDLEKEKFDDADYAPEVYNLIGTF